MAKIGKLVEDAMKAGYLLAADAACLPTQERALASPEGR
jgi:hypothetical protein